MYLLLPPQRARLYAQTHLALRQALFGQYQLRFLVARCLRQLIDSDCNDLPVGAILSFDGE